MSLSAFGDPVHGEVVSSDASGGMAFTLYTAGGAPTARTLLSTEYMTVTDVIFVSTAGGTYDVVFGPAEGVGLRVIKGNAEVKGGLAHHFETPRVGPKGFTPYLFAASGQVDCIITGYINKV
jgi:hypothetical protein